MRDEDIAEVRSRAVLHEVIAEVVTLKRVGVKYVGLCPFHKEKTGSFNVDSVKGFYKCFGCGESGDVFSFVMKIKGLDFPDAVRELAQKFGVTLISTPEERHQSDKRSAYLMLYQQASEYYSHLLQDPVEGQTARDYLYARGITDDVIAKFKLGYATNSWDGLSHYLTSSAKASPQTLEEAGLVRRRAESSGHYDLFRHRLMIPICDDQGRVIAFGGRTLGDDQIKYLNSPETPLYTKGQHLYGFHLAKEEIRKRDAVIVVEGYFDVITSHLYGFHNTVATCGTALTEQQSRLLVKYTESKRVYLAFDADEAGLKAVDKGATSLNQIADGINLDLRVIKIPGGKDPDECLRTKEGEEIVGPVMFARAVEDAPKLIDYQLEKAVAGLNMTSHLGKIDAAKKLVPVLAQLKTEVALGAYVRQWSMQLGIPEEHLYSDIRQYKKSNPAAQSVHPNSQRPRPVPAKAGSRHLISTTGALMSGYVNSEQQLLALYLTSRDDHERVHRHMADEVLISAPHQRIKDCIEGIGTNFLTMEDLHSQLLNRLTPDSEALGAFVEVCLKVEVLRSQNLPVEKIIHEFRVVLLKERITRALSNLRSSLNTAESDVDLNAVQRKIMELNNIQKALANPELPLEEIAILKRKIDDIDELSAKPPEMCA